MRGHKPTMSLCCPDLWHPAAMERVSEGKLKTAPEDRADTERRDREREREKEKTKQKTN